MMMIKHFKATLRHIWRNRLSTTLNLLGLAIGISACWMVYHIVDNKFSYNVVHQGIQAEIPESEEVVPVFFQRVNSTETKRGANKIFVKEHFAYRIDIRWWMFAVAADSRRGC
ncbi:hypothetical protein ACFOET_11530 [Parapedobacter deserti]|uniref:MacB-like periplasmic core domain-containing protein n=1 Tax=Parapedobacter deserti TaxID=1912957 RepID=A0ABV7JJH8_9SPHI